MKFKFFIFCVPLCMILLSCGKKENIFEEEDVVVETPSNIVTATVSKPIFSNLTTRGAVVKSQIVDRGGALITNSGFVWSLTPNPDKDDNKVDASAVNSDGEFSAQFSDLTPGTVYHVRAWAINKGGIGYSEETTLNVPSVQSVAFADGPMFILGSMRAAYDAEIISNGGGEITERGICWGISPNPTIEDHRFRQASMGVGRFRGILTGLTERTGYYLRSYAINEKGVSYGANVSFKTIGKGRLTYTFNRSNTPTQAESEVYARLQVAIDSAVWYVENYTSLTKHVWINYATGTPTADANNEGWMRFGTGVAYQNLRTMLHELNHTVGTGTTPWWWNQAIIGGKYQLSNVNNILRLITKDQSAVLSGDSQHWWPYGLNQNNEVTSSWDYVYNCLIIEAMRKDGMISHSGSYTP